ncbi:substrate-binding domain-containing protein [Streptomyces sp. NPDC059900]|uniref:substrate-binding domain-containing protein n=1 Tax=Streptomyces sp. NPDC059900 TaxID=3155816 RepID=UPI0034210077
MQPVRRGRPPRRRQRHRRGRSHQPPDRSRQAAHRRAIGLQPHLHNGSARLRAEGYRRALDRAGLPQLPDAQCTVAALHRADGARAMDELLDGQAAPDAVFAFSDELAQGALHVAHERGLRVPEDLAVVGFDDIEDSRYRYPALTTIAPDKQQIAERSLQCLADGICSPTAPSLRRN